MNWLLKLIFFAVASLVLVLVLMLSLVGLLFGGLRWLITGQKPQMAVMFSTYRQWKQHAAQHMGRGPRQDDIIDAEVREVPTTHLEDKR